MAVEATVEAMGAEETAVGSAAEAKVEEARVVAGKEVVETAAGVMAEAVMGAVRVEETVEVVMEEAMEEAVKEAVMAAAVKGEAARGVG